ncbi:sulfatase family protein [Cyclobacterium jeungdonense]|uniref:Sulfatase n=1 Tax=Cyclobacterium jeungdonense TaxID=708087 RepID=A0ABT8CCJ8_9BACT|nr:sulfatase [Cyclobacterium jeungdonense]MDN3689538.1 sulfatase [Cyclobacterium jeungdonense]
MIKTKILFLLAVNSVLFLACNDSGTKEQIYSPVNILLITADDLNYNSLGCYGNTIDQITPHIDNLAQSGMRFTNAFVNIAVCQPSRQSIMTGRYPHNNGAPAFDPLDDDVPTLQEQLHKVGYLNGILGKEIHLRPTERFFWDYYIREGDLASGLGIGRDPDLYYQYALEFFTKSKKEGKPFFLMANSHDPHRPFAGSDQEKRIWGEDLPVVTRTILPSEVEVPAFLPDLPEIRKEIAEYYTSVHRMDQTVGALLQALTDAGMADNTMVMFISDNGMAVPFAKSNCYLNSNKTPWIINWPGKIPEGQVDSTHFISGIDFMPTILHALHLPVVPDMDGTSFLPVLQGKTQKYRNTVFTEFHRIFAGIDYSMRCVQEENFGYIVNFWSDEDHEIRGDALSGRTFQAMKEEALEDEAIKERLDLYVYRVPEELYDFKNDPDGLVNLIDDPAYQGDIVRLRELVRKEMKRTADPIQDEFLERFMNE